MSMTNSSFGAQNFTRRDARAIRGFEINSADYRRTAQDGSNGQVGSKNISGLFCNKPLTNKLLRALPDADLTRLMPHLKFVFLSAGEHLDKVDDGDDFAYFPETAVITLLYVSADGSTSEAAMTGREGVVGLPAIFESRQPTYWTKALVAGDALRIRTEILKREFDRGEALQKALLAYVSACIVQLSQRVVCNGRHKVGERLCSWLLMVHDRVCEDTLQLTHEQIASHLGTRRAGVTDAAASLRAQNIIGYTRGFIHILDRPALEAAACECFQTFNQFLTDDHEA